MIHGHAFFYADGVPKTNIKAIKKACAAFVVMQRKTCGHGPATAGID